MATGPNRSASGAASSTARATALTLGLVLVSRVAGVVREMVLARLFGQGETTTLYNAAFSVPDLIALVIAGGAVSSVFIPVFAKYWNENREDDAWRVFGTVLSIAAVAIALIVGVMEIGVVPLTQRLNTAYTPDQVQFTAHLSRILLPAQWCLLIGGLMMGTLYARKRFLVPALGPIVYNVGTIAGGLTQLGSPQPNISAMVWGTLAGAFVGSVVFPLIELSRVGVRWRLGFDIHHEGVQKIGRLIIPVLLGLSLSQLIMWVTVRCLPADYRFSALKNAYTLTQLPIGIFAQAFGIVLLPTISTFAAQSDWPAFRKAVSQGVRRVFFLTIPASCLMAALALPLVRLIFVKGEFTDTDAHAAATALLYYSLGTFAWSGLAILARGFYARQDTWLPVIITTPMVGVFWLLGLLSIAVDPQGFVGLAIAASAVGVATMLLFLFALQKRVGGLNIRAIFWSGLRITLASLVASAPTWFIARWFDRTFEPDKASALVTLLVAGGVGVGLYFGISFVARFPELKTIREMFRRNRTNAADSLPAE